MTEYICVTCGTQFPENGAPPAACPICEDERQYVGLAGQQWTTMEDLQAKHGNRIRKLEPGLIGIASEPVFAIGQRALLVQTSEGNLLWDCITLLDEQTIEAVAELGGIRAIAISHPHYYSSMVEWSRAFNASIYLHVDEQTWVMRPDPAICFWEGEQYPLFGGLTLIRCGGHFPGAMVMHWPAGAEGKGVLLTGDIINVVADRRYVSFMYSFPNLIPLPAGKVRQVVSAVDTLSFDRIYGAWWDKEILTDARSSVRRSADRYIQAITGDGLEKSSG